MYLRSVQLINWRSYRSARFEFPRPHGGKNVVLVMAPNEYGKTSFFEALTLGLFGREGLVLIPRARAVAGNDVQERINVSYSRFLEGTLHHRAPDTGPPECVVKLEWEDETGDPIEIKRTWYFSANCQHKSGDDQLQIYEGHRRVPVSPPLNVEDKDGWYREWIAQHFLQPTLAEFFLFDGEQIQRYASRDMGIQVRRGIEGLLGLPILRSLKSSLERYAQNRRAGAAAPSDTTVNAAKAAIGELEAQIEAKEAELDEADARLPSLDADIDELTQRLGGRGEGTVALVASLFEDEKRYRDEAERAINDLTVLISGDIALAIAGTSLRSATLGRLQSEAKREAWETGRDEGNRNLDRFTADLSARIGRLEPPLHDSRRDAVIAAAKEAWAALWHPPPDGCADGYLHPALAGTTRAGVIDRLKAVGRHSAGEVSGHVERFEAAVTTAEAKKRERLELERIAPEIDEQAGRLRELTEQSGRCKEQRDAAEREIDAATAELGDRRAELARYVSRLGTHAPALTYAARADAYAKLIDDLLEGAVPYEVGEVAVEMTKTWKAMAHMSDRVERIDISPDCEVRMLTADGSDLHRIDKSAGASQVFTQALITAITKISGRTFPFVVDTPLARLSRVQRIGVLKTFTDRPGQVILLSTDQEVVDDKLDAIRDRIIASYELKVAHDEGVAVTTVHELDLRTIRQ